MTFNGAKGFWLVLATVVSVLACDCQVYAQSSPISCFKKDQAEIECNVFEQELRIKDIILNRGNCKSPVLKGNDRELGKKYYEELPRDAQESLKIPFVAMITLFESKGDEKLARAIEYIYDPSIKTYKFGDKINFGTGDCNLLEVVIETTDGYEATFQWR